MTRSSRRPRSEGRLARLMRDAEREILLSALRKHNGSMTRTALDLGIGRRGLYAKVQAYGLEGEAAGLRAEAGIPGRLRTTCA